MPLLKVADVMRDVPAVIAPENTLRDAVRIMKEEKTNGLIVVNAEQRVIGILSSWDVIQVIVPDYLEEDRHLAAFESGDTFAARITELADIAVSTFMTTPVQTVSPDDTLMQAATILSESHIRQLPVVQADGMLVGYLNRTDMKLKIAELLGV